MRRDFVDVAEEQLLREIKDELKAQTAVLLEVATILKGLSDHSARASEEMGRRLESTASTFTGTPFEGMVRNLMTAVKE